VIQNVQSQQQIIWQQEREILKYLKVRKEGREEEGKEGRSQDGWAPETVIHGVSTAKTHMGASHVGTVQSELHSSDLLISCLQSIPVQTLSLVTE